MTEEGSQRNVMALAASAGRGPASRAPAARPTSGSKRWVRRVLVSLFVSSLALGARAQTGSGGATALGDPSGRRLIATVITRDDRGRVLCAIWRGAEGYPTERARAVGQTIDRTIVRRSAVCTFEGVTPGEYALAVFHDENGNNDLDRNVLGIPTEGTGASNDASNPFGPPGYDDARFVFPDMSEYRIRVNIHY